MRTKSKLMVLGMVAAMMLASPAAAQMGGGMGGGGMGGGGAGHMPRPDGPPADDGPHVERGPEQVFISLEKFDRAVTEMFKSADLNHDGMVTLAGCDKSLPGMLMAAARLNLPSVFLYGGSILPGRVRDRAIDITSVFEAVGANAVDALSDEELSLIEHNACPTEGSCAGMFTANTMSTIAEAIGMMLPHGASHPADYDARSGIHADVAAQARAHVIGVDAAIVAAQRRVDLGQSVGDRCRQRRTVAFLAREPPEA